MQTKAMNSKDLIQKGIEKKLIAFSEDKTSITYLHQDKKRKYTNHEEQVQALCFLKLVLEYKYPAQNIKILEPVKMGSATKEADMIVFKDKECLSPYIVVECKKQEISDLEFKSAVAQAFSYGVACGASFVWISSSLKDEYYQILKDYPRKQQTISDIPSFGSNKIPQYRFIKGTTNDIKDVKQNELTQIFKQAHDTLWGGGELNPSQAFDELDKLIFCKIWDEKHTEDDEPYKFQIYTYKDDESKDIETLINKELQKRIFQLYEEGRKKDPEVFKDDIRLSTEKIRAVVGYLQGVNLSATDLDSKGRAFETFMDSFFRGHFGQYFTPREIVKFIVDVLPINNESLVLDSSCGSGGFLLHALDKVRKLADEKFKIRNTPEKILKHHNFWHDFAQNNLFGIEINEQIARVAKMNMIIHDDGHTNVIVYDGLAPIDKKDVKLLSGTLTDEEKTEQIKIAQLNEFAISNQNENFRSNHFDFIITNPPFGSSIKQTEKAYLSTYRFGKTEASWLDLKPYRKERANQSTEILFIEQAHKFLKEKGILAIVIPDGILTNSSLQYVRDSIEELYRIVAVISMPQSAFSHTGAGVKSSVLFLQKHTEAMQKKIKNLKEDLQNKLKKNENYEKQMIELENAKKAELKAIEAEYKTDKENPKFKEEKANIAAIFREKTELLQSKMQELYKNEKSRLFEERGLDYEIFMAIAENIGYDATGKKTDINELDTIAKELEIFIRDLV